MSSPEHSPEQSGGNEIAPLIITCSNCDDYFFLDTTNSHVVDYDLESKKDLNHLYTCCPHCGQGTFQFTHDDPFGFVRYHTNRAIPVITMQEPYPLVEELFNRGKQQTNNAREPKLTPVQEGIVNDFGALLLKYIKTPSDFNDAVEFVSDETPNTIKYHYNNGNILSRCNSCNSHYIIDYSNTELLISEDDSDEEPKIAYSICPHCKANSLAIDNDLVGIVKMMSIKT